MPDDGRNLGSGFSDVDRESDADVFFQLLDAQAAMPAIVASRARALRLLELAPGLEVLDVGCGTGEVARAIADAVAPGGRVVAADASERMLEEAARRTPEQLRVEFRRTDAAGTGFDDASFDRVHSERVLQHVPDPERAVDEMTRVLRPGGRIVLVDTDWETAVADIEDVELGRRLRAHGAEAFANGTVGRRLFPMLKRRGYLDLAVHPQTLVLTADAPRGFAMGFTRSVDSAAAANAISPAEAERIRDEVARRLDDDTFFAAVTMFAVAGVKPR